MFLDNGGRHYYIAKHLKAMGFSPTIICASTIHNSNEEIGSYVKDKNFHTEIKDDIKYIFIKTRIYEDNGLKRVLNMIDFFKNLLKSKKKIANIAGKPDVIYASSVHPLTLIAGINLSKYFKAKNISEVRDLWPESLIAYNIIKSNSLIAKLLYLGEKNIYKRAEEIVMTWPGGQKYIKLKGWENEIDLNKIRHISNGVDLQSFDSSKRANLNKIKSQYFNDTYRHIIYTGSIRKVNNITLLVEVAKKCELENMDNIVFDIFGDGSERKLIEEMIENYGLKNIRLHGKVPKEFIPAILNFGYINILHNKSTILDKYGQSQNKLFEYLAAGNCILQTYRTNYSIIEEKKCGLIASEQTAEQIFKQIVFLNKNPENVKQMGKNARKASKSYDYKLLTNNLVELIGR